MAWIIASGALHNFNLYTIGTFLNAYLQRWHGLGLREASDVAAVVLGVSGAIGLVGGGRLADRAAARRGASGRLALGSLAMLLAAPCLLAALLVHQGNAAGFLVLAGLGMLAAYVYYPCVYAAIQDLVEPGARGSAMALYFFAMYVLGGSLGPTITGGLSDHLANAATREAGESVVTESFKALGLHRAMFVTPVLSLSVAIVLLLGARSARRADAGGERQRDSKRSS
jgi:MFS family permease